jgi:hypothetical protein
MRQMLATWELTEGAGLREGEVRQGGGQAALPGPRFGQGRGGSAAWQPLTVPHAPARPPRDPAGSFSTVQQLPDTLEFLQLLTELDAAPAGGGGAAAGAAAAAAAAAGATGAAASPRAGGGRARGARGGSSDGGAGAGADAELPERRAARGLFRWARAGLASLRPILCSASLLLGPARVPAQPLSSTPPPHPRPPTNPPPTPPPPPPPGGPPGQRGARPRAPGPVGRHRRLLGQPGAAGGVLWGGRRGQREVRRSFGGWERGRGVMGGIAGYSRSLVLQVGMGEWVARG